MICNWPRAGTGGDPSELVSGMSLVSATAVHRTGRLGFAACWLRSKSDGAERHAVRRCRTRTAVKEAESPRRLRVLEATESGRSPERRTPQASDEGGWHTGTAPTPNPRELTRLVRRPPRGRVETVRTTEIQKSRSRWPQWLRRAGRPTARRSARGVPPVWPARERLRRGPRLSSPRSTLACETPRVPRCHAPPA